MVGFFIIDGWPTIKKETLFLGAYETLGLLRKRNAEEN
jgi:hypothetical protein